MSAEVIDMSEYRPQDAQRWLVRLLVTRDPNIEGPPDQWDWNALLDGGDCVVILAQQVGIDAIPPEVLPEVAQ